MKKMKTIAILASFFFATTTFAANIDQSNNDCLKNIEDKVDKHSLFLDKCELVDDDIKTVADFLRTHDFIREISLAENNLKGNSLDQLALPQIIGLDLADNQIDDFGVVKLASAFKNSQVETISIDNNLITDDGAIQLAAIPSLMGLSLSGHKGITDKTANFIAFHSNLTQILISHTGVTSKGVRDLTKNPKLIGLALDNLGLTNEDTKYIADLHELVFLTLSDNNLTTAGAMNLFGLTNLKLLMMENNPISDAGAIGLANLPSLLLIGLEKTKIGSSTAIALSKNESIFFMFLGKNHIEDEGAFALAKDADLIWLDVSYNKISQQGINALMDSPSIIFLQVDGNVPDLHLKTAKLDLNKSKVLNRLIIPVIPKIFISKYLH